MRIEEKGRNKDVVKLKEKERERKRVTFFLTRIVHSLTRLVSIGALGGSCILFVISKNTCKRGNSWSSQLPVDKRSKKDLTIRNYLPSFFVDLPMHGVHRVQDLVPSRDDPLCGGVYRLWPVSIVTIARGTVTQPESGGKIKICDWLHN